MLSRAALPLLRPRSFHTATRLTFSQCQIRGMRNDRGRLHQPTNFTPSSSTNKSSDKYKAPIRPVPASQGENLAANSSASEPTQSNHPTSESSPATPDQQVPPSSSQPLPDLRDGIPSDYNPDAEPQRPLPDLTQGIPSTIDAELQQAHRKSAGAKDSFNITEEPVDPQSSEPAERGGDGLPRTSYVSSSDRRRSKLTKYFYISLGLGTVVYGLYMGREWNGEELEVEAYKEIPNGWTPGLVYQRAMARWGSTVSYYKDPVLPKVLPDAALMDPNMPPYTLVLGLEDVLVHSEWSREHGWRIAKRPGLDYFIRYLSPYYELVIFSNQPQFTADQVHRKIDPFQMAFPLNRDATRYEDGGYVKDLSYLNRDLKKVIMVDADAHHAKAQPENAIVLPKWTGDPKDTTLIDLIPFLEYTASVQSPDFREVLRSYQGTNIATEFDRRENVKREKLRAQLAEKKKRTKSSFSLGSVFGSTRPQPVDGVQSILQAEAEGKIWSDIVRERGQLQYKRMTEHLEKEGPRILQEREEMEKKMQEEGMANLKSGMFGWFGSGDKNQSK